MAKRAKDQPLLFENPPAWVDMWQGMPEFKHSDLTPWHSLVVHFRSREDYEAFSQIVGQRLTAKQKYIWHPEIEMADRKSKQFASHLALNPSYPIYVISKGRAESRLTSKALERIGVPYWIVIEPQEKARYSAVIDPAKILVLPFSNLGQGSIPARNWVWEHSLANGDARHWILDDNIANFRRYQDNLEVPVGDGSIFKIAEDFADRYENVAISGFNYEKFIKRKFVNPPFYFNTRIYSCILIKNDIPYRWRGRYNEDTDLSIRALKDEWCTILFNAFLCDKIATMTMKGGNTDELYKDDGRLKMAESLRDQHPDCVTITQKFGRWQHQVDYSRFKKNKLKLKPGVVIPEGVDDYGMSLKILGGENGESIPAAGDRSGSLFQPRRLESSDQLLDQEQAAVSEPGSGDEGCDEAGPIPDQPEREWDEDGDVPF